MTASRLLLSILVPAYNEQANVQPLYKKLSDELGKNKSIDYEIVYVDDGSTDNTQEEIKDIASKDKRVRLVTFSRNFGKEMATTAAINAAKGDALVIIDADGQHPPELIHEFVQRWQAGARVVVGVRKQNQKEGLVKRYGSKLFYSLFNTLAGLKLVSGATDFGLIDRSVRDDFVQFNEHNRITRGLVDWMGYKKEYVEFNANARMSGPATYNLSKLVKLATNSFVSLSITPLYFAGWAGLLFTLLSLVGGLFVIIEQFLLNDPLGLNITGTAMLGILLVFLVGMLLTSQGVLGLYISHIHAETKDRPLYIIDKKNSINP